MVLRRTNKKKKARGEVTNLPEKIEDREKGKQPQQCHTQVKILLNVLQFSEMSSETLHQNG